MRAPPSQVVRLPPFTRHLCELSTYSYSERAEMGGSQLTQLKSTLRASGLSRTSSPKDAKKRSKQRKELSATSQAHRSTKLDDIGKDFNQFDLRQEKRKFDVVTRQGKLEQGKKGAPTKSRTAGLELVCSLTLAHCICSR